MLEEANGEKRVDQGGDLGFGQWGKKAEGAESIQPVFLNVLGLGADEHAGDHLLAEATFSAGDAGEDDTDGVDGFCAGGWRIVGWGR